MGSDHWTIHKTRYTGNVRDAHNTISIAVDGNGVLHISWGMHGQPLLYARGKQPGSLEMTDHLHMTGNAESHVTYPQFYNLPDGDLLFAYRKGGSGNGNFKLNRYDIQTETWHIVQRPLIDGQRKRNAYINTSAIDSESGIHVSWCWRETPDVASNHDVAYAYSHDQGKSWHIQRQKM